ncbi:hypothetical protein JHK87_034531 [Glycine soja]|nr:hypothetical protein JHK87_034531 [Glycine soja]
MFNLQEIWAKYDLSCRCYLQCLYYIKSELPSGDLVDASFEKHFMTLQMEDSIDICI